MTEPIWIDSDLVPVIHDRQLAEQAGQKGCMTKRFCIRPSGARRVTWRPSPPTPWCWQANARQASSKITRLSMGSNAPASSWGSFFSSSRACNSPPATRTRHRRSLTWHPAKWMRMGIAASFASIFKADRFFAILINGRVDQAESDRDSGGTAASFRRTT
jgi:hypothetical protein